MSSIITILLLGFLTRRLLGVPVGWPRTIVVSLAVVGIIGVVATQLADTMGLLDAQGAPALDADPVAAGLVYVLVMAWGIAVGLGILVILEAMVPTGTLPQPLLMLRDLPARFRRSRRYTHIVRIAVRHGLGGFLRSRGRAALGEEAPRVARALRLALTDAGVTFVKLGQMLSTRPDLVGEEFAGELGRLTSRVAPQPWEEVERTLSVELGRDTTEVFAQISREPLAAASVGQVHAARLRGGSDVVVKVQRSDARAQVVADVDIICRLARRLERTTGWGRSLRVASLAQGFADSLAEELDYRVEAANTDAVRRVAAGSGIRVPRIHTRWSGPRVLVMERMPGLDLSQAGAWLAGRSPQERQALARTLLSSVLHQILDHGIFHADLHPGNVLVDNDGELSLLDFGSVGRLDKAARAGMARLVLAVDRGDPVMATDALIELLGRPRELDDRGLEREVGPLIARYGSGLGAAGSSELFGDLMAVVVRHGFSVPPQVAAAFRALAAVEGALRLLDPDIDVVDASREIGRELFGKRLAPAALRTELEDRLLQVLPVLQRLPRRLDAIADATQRGQLRVGVRVLAHADDRAFITGMVSQLVMTLLAGAAAVCAVLLVLADGGPVVAEGIRLLPVLGITLFLFAFVLAARALALAFRHTASQVWAARELPP